MPPAPRPSSSPFPCLLSPLPVCPRTPRLTVSCRPSAPILSIQSPCRLHPLPGRPARRILRSSLACLPCTLSPGERPPCEAAIPSGWLPNGFAAMQHEPHIGHNPRWIKRFLCAAQKISELSLPPALPGPSSPKELHVTRSIFSLFPPISAGQARPPAPRVHANRRRCATNGRNGPLWTQVRNASVRSGGCRRRPCHRSFRAGTSSDRLGPLQLHCGRRCHRQRPRSGKPGCTAPPGEPHQVDDIVHG